MNDAAGPGCTGRREDVHLMNDYETGMNGMRDALKDHEKLIRGFTRKQYADTFKDYYMSLLPAMDAIENLYQRVVDKDAMLTNMASGLAEEADGLLSAAKKRDRERLNINLSLVMAGYVFPVFLRYKGDSSRPLVEHVLKAWKEKFPKSNLTPAEYDEIEAGFHKKFCFITTACCRNRNKPDDCYELTLLRRYRDTYMASLPEGEKLITAYYDIAPSIVKHISRRPDADSIYDTVWNTYILPCISLIESGKYEECLALYEKMVMELKEKYFYQGQASMSAAGSL